MRLSSIFDYLGIQNKKIICGGDNFTHHYCSKTKTLDYNLDSCSYTALSGRELNMDVMNGAKHAQRYLNSQLYTTVFSNQWVKMATCEDKSSSKVFEWRYRIMNKEPWRKAQNTTLENFLQQ